MAFPGEGNPNFQWDKSPWDNTVVKGKKKKKEEEEEEKKEEIKLQMD